MRETKLIVWLMCAVFLVACSPSKRLARLVTKHPELINSDTVFRHDTTITQHITKDTSFVFAHYTDTFTVEKEKLKVRIIHDHDTIRVSAEVVPDTIIKEIPVTVNTVTPVKQLKMRWYLWLLLVFLCAVMIYVTLKKAIK